MIKRIIPYSKSLISEYLTESSITVDMTMGNGNDTLFLAKNSKFCFAFDIQEQAIQSTKNLLNKEQIDNVKLILDSHSNIDKYITDEVDCIMFNLGYLPGGDQSITTNVDSTLVAIDKSLTLLKKKGLVSITLYPGHDEGAKEAQIITDKLNDLSSKEYNVLLYKMMNKDKSPFNIFIEKL